MPGIPNNLPQQLTSFIGRSADIEAVSGSLEKSRLVTITGAGGLGKTRLAIEVASRLFERFPDGVWFVDLVAHPKNERVHQSVALAIGVRFGGSTNPASDLSVHLCAKQALLILDNCEHVIDPCAHLVDELLRTCPDLVILTTSRQAFNIDGEVLYRLAPLELPEEDHRLDVYALRQCDALQLFLERARGRRGDFDLTA